MSAEPYAVLSMIVGLLMSLAAVCMVGTLAPWWATVTVAAVCAWWALALSAEHLRAHRSVSVSAGLLSERTQR